LFEGIQNYLRGSARAASRGEEGRAFLGASTRRQVNGKRLACPRVEGNGTFLSALPTQAELADGWQSLRMGKADIVRGQGRGFGQANTRLREELDNRPISEVGRFGHPLLR
jgi:hypothetical protein